MTMWKTVDEMRYH